MDSIKKNPPVYSNTDTGKVTIGNDEWRKILPADVYNIAREKGTERAFTGKYWDHKEVGAYYCAACGNPLFRSNGKFESNCGWPSFFDPIEGAVTLHEDHSHGMQRIEVRSASSGIHLGHVFDDGPAPSYKRYCINGNVLKFIPD